MVETGVPLILGHRVSVSICIFNSILGQKFMFLLLFFDMVVTIFNKF